MISLRGYEIINEIHRNPRFTVFKGIQTRTSRPVFIKYFPIENILTANLAQFAAEYDRIMQLNSDNVVKIYDFERIQELAGSGLVLIYEYLQGIGLKEYIEDKRNKGIYVSTREFLNIAVQLASAVNDIHRVEIVHKEFNPSAIIINPESGKVIIKEFPFHTVLTMENHQVYSQDSFLDTLPYISPEHTGRMNKNVDYRSDFFSIGVIFYEILTGESPFKSVDPLEIIHSLIALHPAPPLEKNHEIPLMISEITMKLLAKNPEERYQSAYGLKSDLLYCLEQLNDHGRIDNFIIAGNDINEELQIPGKLYGREKETASLVDGFELSITGKMQVVFVNGYSGVGKSSLVHNIYKYISKKSGNFITGKYDEFQRTIPYSAIIQSIQELISRILTTTPEEINKWKETIIKGLESNGQLIIKMIPELELIIGGQHPAAESLFLDIQNIFNLTFKNFIKGLASRDHPLTIFLDDLQWADSASLELIEALLTPDLEYLFFVGSYRDNEIDDTHPLTGLMRHLHESAVSFATIPLTSLSESHVRQLISDSIKTGIESVQQLARIVYEMTGGNPFFVRQYLQTLYKEKLLYFNFSNGQWEWDISKIKSREITGDILDLMSAKINKLDGSTREILKLAACIGNKFDLNILTLVGKTTSEETAMAIWNAVQEGLIVPVEESYRYLMEMAIDGKERAKIEVDGLSFLSSEVTLEFMHDRVRQAAYSLIPHGQRQELHLYIGRMLLSTIPENELEEQIFEVVNQLNHGKELITAKDERNNVARLNLAAGRKARAAAAYSSAFAYLKTGVELLTDDNWKTNYQLALDLHVETAEAAYLCAESHETEKYINIVLRNAVSILDKIKVYEISIMSHNTQNKFAEAVEIGLQALRMLGIHQPARPGKLRMLIAFLKTKAALAVAFPSILNRHIEDLEDMPEMTDPHSVAIMRILTSMSTAAYMTSPGLHFLNTCKEVITSLKYGNAQQSIDGYLALATIMCGVTGDIEGGWRLGETAMRILDKQKENPARARYVTAYYAFILHWKAHPGDTLHHFIESYHKGLQAGDIEYAAYSLFIYSTYELFIGHKLPLIENNMAENIHLISQLKHESALYLLNISLQAVQNLMGKSGDPCILKGEFYDEDKMLQLHKNDRNITALSIYCFYKSVLCFLFMKYADALEFCKMMEQYLDGIISTFAVPVFNFYNSLIKLSVYDNQDVRERKKTLKQVKFNQKKLKHWAELAPMNHMHKFYLVEAELARVLGKDESAVRYYDMALDLAEKNGYIQEEALAYESGARFFLSKGREKIARIYMQEAYNRYERWGAKARVHDIEARYSSLILRKPYKDESSAFSNTEEREDTDTLDIGTVMKASQAISSEIELDKLIRRLMKILVENAGAEKGVLILQKKDALFIEAVSSIDNKDVNLLNSIPLNSLEISENAAKSFFPLSMIYYIQRTGQTMVLNDAQDNYLFNSDIYIQNNRPRSILCMPILQHSKKIGILYLENRLTKDAFTPKRLEMLKLLSSQAANALENAMLYENLRKEISEREKAERAVFESEKRYRILAENVIDFIWAMDMNLQSIFISPSVKLLTGYTVEEMISKPMQDVLTPESFYKAYEAYKKYIKNLQEGTFSKISIETGFIHKDGTIVPTETTISLVLDSSGRPEYIVGVTRDITERKKAEEEIIKFKTITDNARYGSLIFNFTGEILYINNYSAELLGYSVDELTGRTYDLLLDAEELYTLAAIINELKQYGSFAAREVWHRHKDGHKIPMLISGTIIKNARGKPHFVAGTGIDISMLKESEREQKQLEIKLQQARKMEAIGTLAGGIAHDFNNLLMGIQGNTSLLLLESGKDSPSYEKLKNIEYSVKSGSNLTKQLLGFARSGKYEVKVTDLNELAGRTSSLYGQTQKGITIHEKYNHVWTVEVDQVQIEQVLLNIYVNAWKAMPDGGDLYIETDNIMLNQDFIRPYKVKHGRYVKLSITDTGIGMDAATRERIFEPFFTTDEIGKGAGLGLASAYGIIKNHSGIIDVYSEKGIGTTITIYLPASDKKIIKEAAPVQGIVKGSETILLVDDEEIILDVAAKIMSKLGYKIFKARTGKEAIDIFKEKSNEIDLVILDMIMPDLNGGETFDRLKAMDPDVKVILSSGYCVEGQATAILERGCNGFIQKPFNVKEFSSKIREVLDK